MQPEENRFENPDWLDALRETGAEVFDATGLPTPANEDWKYSSLRKYEREGFEPIEIVPEININDLPEKRLDQRLVFVNGIYYPSLSDKIAGIERVNLQSWLRDNPSAVQENLVDVGDLFDMPLKAENTSSIYDGAAFVIDAGVHVEKPIEILYFSTDKGQKVKPKSYLRNLFVLHDGAHLQVLENYEGQGTYAVNHVCDIALQDNAVFKHYRLQNEDVRAYHFCHTRLMQHVKSSYETVTLTRGACFSRHDIQSLLIGREVSCNINGLYMLNGVQHYDTKILADHMEPDGNSNQLYKGILDDEARTVFQGKIHVRRPAQGTDGRQLSNALLLSAAAEIDAKPELEIYADDVQCAHGATSGSLDEEPLFYMQTRGIPEDDARRLLMGSFLSDVIKDIECDNIRSIFQNEIDGRLAAMQGAK